MEKNHDFVQTSTYSDFYPTAKGELQDSLPDGTGASSDNDVHKLALLGKKQVLKVQSSEFIELSDLSDVFEA